MRYYLDTNVLIFILSDNQYEISAVVSDILVDYANNFYVSSTAVQELILLHRIGKIKDKKYKSEENILREIKNSGIEIVFFNEHHFSRYIQLKTIEKHKDMNDHAIIAQAISDKIPIISADHEFKNYISQGLNLVFNKR
ncbi:MAG: PIN domain-containing protein [Prevotellaceae bacterium]|jgi:PIN domain nuclease of toxin-antitoxin system|nr:PIN domain-containing protein [Prevotellaceae bacterium]